MTETLLEARDLQLGYGGKVVVDGVDLELTAGSSLGVVGESGCGKTTLARALVGWVSPSAGSLTVEGRAWRDVKRDDELRRSVQMIFQDPYTSLNPRLTARETVAEVFRVWERLGAKEAAERAGALLDEVGLPARAMDRRPRQLSGGQCQRVGIARALAARPRLLVADEPTSSLDVSVQAQILNLLLELRAAHGLTMVLISHDLSVVRYMTERAIVMYGGRIVEAGPTAELFERPAHPYTRLLIDSIPGQRDTPPAAAKRDAPAAGCVFAHRCPRFAAEPCAERHPDVATAGERAFACYRPLTAEPS